MSIATRTRDDMEEAAGILPASVIIDGIGDQVQARRQAMDALHRALEQGLMRRAGIISDILNLLYPDDPPQDWVANQHRQRAYRYLRELDDEAQDRAIAYDMQHYPPTIPLATAVQIMRDLFDTIPDVDIADASPTIRRGGVSITAVLPLDQILAASGNLHVAPNLHRLMLEQRANPQRDDYNTWTCTYAHWVEMHRDGTWFSSDSPRFRGATPDNLLDYPNGSISRTLSEAEMELARIYRDESRDIVPVINAWGSALMRQFEERIAAVWTDDTKRAQTRITAITNGSRYTADGRNRW